MLLLDRLFIYLLSKISSNLETCYWNFVIFGSYIIMHIVYSYVSGQWVFALRDFIYIIVLIVFGYFINKVKFFRKRKTYKVLFFLIILFTFNSTFCYFKDLMPLYMKSAILPAILFISVFNIICWLEEENKFKNVNIVFCFVTLFLTIVLFAAMPIGVKGEKISPLVKIFHLSWLLGWGVIFLSMKYFKPLLKTEVPKNGPWDDY